jgi:SAM-dependent methyltransferase
MSAHIEEYLPKKPMLIGDLGSYNVNGSYRALIEPRWTYVGIDREEGPNVDLVMPKEYRIPVADNHFDALISGQCFEHVRNPFKLMNEVARVVKPDGIVLIVAPFIFGEHRFPVDCWRFLRDGWQALFDESGIEMLNTKYVKINSKGGRDAWAIGRVK